MVRGGEDVALVKELVATIPPSSINSCEGQSVRFRCLRRCVQIFDWDMITGRRRKYSYGYIQSSGRL